MATQFVRQRYWAATYINVALWKTFKNKKRVGEYIFACIIDLKISQEYFVSGIFEVTYQAADILPTVHHLYRSRNAQSFEEKGAL